jgi:hypothetical protein
MSDSEPYAMSETELLGNITEQTLRTLEDFEVINSVGTGAIIYSRRFGAFNDLTRSLKSVAVAASLGLKSIDYARKTYLPDDLGESDRKNPGSDATHLAYVAAYHEAREYMLNCQQALLTNPNVALSLGTYAASVALERLRSGFTAAHTLYSLGLNIEGDAVARQVLEQIAWAIAASQVTSDEEIKNVSATRAISRLKRLAPYSGRLYNWLSNNVHAGLSQHLEAFTTDESDRGIILTSWNRRPVSAEIILQLADLWVIAYERTQSDHMTQFVAIDPQADFMSFADRPFLRRMSELVGIVKDAYNRSATGAT